MKSLLNLLDNHPKKGSKFRYLKFPGIFFTLITHPNKFSTGFGGYYNNNVNNNREYGVWYYEEIEFVN